MRPQRRDYKTRAEYRWADKQWRKSHGGSLIAVCAIALVIGGLSGSSVVVGILLVAAIGGWIYLRTRS